MRRLCCSAVVACGLMMWTEMASGQDSGPGPIASEASKQYNVVVIRASGFEQGTLTFDRSIDSTPDIDPAADDDSATVNNTTGTSPGGDDGLGTTNPVATGSIGTTNPSATSNTTNTGTATNTSGTPTTAEAVNTEPPSYWTQARVNGHVATSTNDPSSSDYWTRARANGQGGAGDSTGIGGGEEENRITSGAFAADFSEQSTTGTWNAVDLGSFSLWYATADSSAGSVIYIGYATPDTIVGRTSIGTDGFIETLFRGSLFVGQAADSPTEESVDLVE